MDILFLRLPDTAAESYQLYLRPASGQLSRLPDCTDQDALHKVAQAHAEARVIALVPATELLFSSVLVSARQLKQVGSAVAYLMEEQLGEDIDNLHVLQAPQQADGQVPLLLVSEARMQAWMQPIKAAGLRLDAMLPSLLLLPHEKHSGLELPPSLHWTLGLGQGMAQLRTGAFSGAGLESDNLPGLLQAARLEAGPLDAPLELTVLGADADELACVEAWVRQQAGPVQLRLDPRDVPQLLLATEPAALLRHPFNLLQGPHASRRARTLSPAWKWAAMFVGAAFGLQLLAEWLQYGYYEHKAQQSQQQALALYQQLFPQDRGVSTGNLRRRMEAHLQGAGPQLGLLPLLTQVGEGMQGMSVQTQSVDFDADLKKLTLDISAQSLSQLEQLKQQLEGQGLQIEILSANAQGTGVRGRLKIVAG